MSSGPRPPRRPADRFAEAMIRQLKLGPARRIRLQVAGGAHPRFARNLGVPLDLANGSDSVPVTHRIWHTIDYPSALSLPVVPATAPRSPASEAGELAAEV
jgi:uncharacterized protein